MSSDKKRLNKRNNKVSAQIAILDPEQIEYIPAKTLLRLMETHQKVQKSFKLFNQTVSALPVLFRGLEEMELEPSFNLGEDYISLSFTGDGPKLTAVWKLLRQCGYNSNDRPKKGDTTFYSFWSGPEGVAKIFLNFSSTVCRRVQVGTKMVETPIYETQCGELPEIEPPATAVVTTSGDFDDDIPF